MSRSRVKSIADYAEKTLSAAAIVHSHPASADFFEFFDNRHVRHYRRDFRYFPKTSLIVFKKKKSMSEEFIEEN